MVNAFLSTDLWGGLFADKSVSAQFSAAAFLERCLAFEIAWTQALAQVSATSRQEADRCVAVLRDTVVDLADLARGADRDGLAVPELIRLLRAKAGGQSTEAIHKRATSQDVIDTAMVLTCVDVVRQFEVRLDGIIASLDRLEAKFGDRTMMGRTRMQAALPIPVHARLSKWRALLVARRAEIAALLADLGKVQVESTHEAFEAGASIVHAHVRKDDETPSSDPDKFAALKEGLDRHCRGMIVQFSTGGRSGAGQDRGGMLPLRPDMASLSVGSNNFPTRVYENPPDLVDWLASEMLIHDVKPEIEAFDLSHILKARDMADNGQLKGTPYIQFVMGVKNATPADRHVFEYYVQTVHRLFGADAPWCAAGIGAKQSVLNIWAIAAGGHARTGLEDNLRLDRDTLAPSNAALVKRAVAVCEAYERPVATAQQARDILYLRPVR